MYRIHLLYIYRIYLPLSIHLLSSITFMNLVLVNYSQFINQLQNI
jgi:hypothetical protein